VEAVFIVLSIVFIMLDCLFLFDLPMLAFNVKKATMKNSKNKALKLAIEALKRTDEAIQKFVSQETLPEPLDCEPGCHYCCYNLPVVTPPEVLLIGYHVEGNFSDREKQELTDRTKKILDQTTDKQPDEIAMMRHELPCIFLRKGMCMVYQIRPVVCRTCSSTSAEHCKAIFESRNHRARLRCYLHIREIFHTVQNDLVNSCKKMGFQSDLSFLAAAINDYFKHPRPIEAWLRGETVFDIG